MASIERLLFTIQLPGSGMRRRTFLATASTLALTLAGCSGDSGGITTPSATSTATAEPTPSASPTPSPTPTADPYVPEDAREEATSPSYEQLFRRIEDYEGEPVRFEWAQVYHVQYNDGNDYIQMYVANNDRQMEGDVAASWYGDQRILEGDEFNPAIGVVERLYEYETVRNDVRTIPYLTLVEYDMYDESNPPSR